MHAEQNTDISCEKKELTSRACLSCWTSWRSSDARRFRSTISTNILNKVE